MTDTNRFGLDRSTYERPNFPFRCGREAAFGKPCPRGPTAGGVCQGVADCEPFQTRKVTVDPETGKENEILRWECRRPSWAGGPCAEGPRPDGSCACVHPPCAPRSTIRRQRGRWAWVAIAAVVSLVVGFAGLNTIEGFAGVPSSLDPGALSGKHQQFTAGDGCVSCHAGHSATLTGWATALFETKKVSDGCVSCHAFGGEEGDADAPSPLVFAAHNRTFPDRADQPTADCVGCHTEHRGEHASIIPVVDGQCASCHTEKFDNFAESHPAFGPKFPHESARTIKFPHDKHFGQHFQDPRYEDRAPQNGCQSCHNNQVDGRLLPGSFEEGCAACHEDAIKEQGFQVFGLPELSDPSQTAGALETCGFAPAQIDPAKSIVAALEGALPALESLNEARESADPEALASAAETLAEAQETLAEAKEELDSAIEEDSISFDTLTPAMGYLLGVDHEDIDAYSEPAAEFLVASAEEGRGPLAAAIEERGGDPAVLLAGLTPEMVTRVTCAWVANAEYEPVSYPEPGDGWAAVETNVSYLPTGHADPVVKSWIGFALAARGQDTDGADAFAERITDPSEGPGRCFKCHVAPEADAPSPTEVGWNIPRKDVRPHTTFNHLPHLNVLDKGQGCATCHRALGADETLGDAQRRPGAFANNFKPIEATICAECHHDGGVRQDCGLCHRYHSDPSIRKRTM